MPVLDNKHKNVKVYRPGGTRWAEGRARSWGDAIAWAYFAFQREFDYVPSQRHVVIEVIGTSSDFIAQVFEVRD